LSVRTGADAVAFLLSNEFGDLDLAGQLSSDSGYKPQISQQLNDEVLRKRRAVWLHQESDDPGIASGELGKKAGFADAICVPLHLYSRKVRFQRRDFDFAIAVSSVVGVTLVRVLSSQSLAAELGRLQVKNADFNELIGNSEGMVELKDRICRIARASGCILVRGESGAGKELVARAIHRNSQRSSRPMLSVNCAAIPDELMESQLFGHVKGAFTGADREHIGFFQQANKGTLFLDEVGELNLEGQAKLLRILEGHPFLPVGATQEIQVDVRVISATNRDLREFVAEKRFREDLYYRLSVFELHIPPLRERGADIDILVGLFLEHFKKQNGRKNLSISPEAMEVLRNYSWPGNVRQLRNVIDSSVVLADGKQILPRDLSLRDVGNISQNSSTNLRIDPPSSSITTTGKALAPDSPVEPSPAKLGSKDSVSSSGDFDTLSVEVWEQRLIQEALRRTQGSIPAAAELMGMSRATLYRKLEKSQIPPESLPPDANS
jgi:transcriptional regulator with GAF, ATPase, and Fis domain